MMLRHGPQIRFVAQVEPALVLRNAWAWERVLINLFCNAVQAMPQGGAIFVEAYRNNGNIQIVVADEGSGIAPELLAVIFDPRVSTKVLGGLGLHIVHSIVTQEAGVVRVSNRQGAAPNSPSRYRPSQRCCECHRLSHARFSPVGAGSGGAGTPA